MPTQNRAGAILVTFIVWGLAGSLFGGLFAGLHDVLVVVGLSDWQPLVLGAGAAAMTTAAFYSAMPVALVGAMAGVLASLAYLMVVGHQVRLLLIAGAAAVAGLIAGVFYSWMSKGSGRPLARTMTGLLAGLGAGVLLWGAMHLYGGEIRMLLLAAGVVALVGTLFTLSEGFVVSALSAHCPRHLSAPVVAALIASVVGASVWIMGGVTAAGLDPSTKGAIDQVLRQVPAGFLGGMLGGAVTGVVLELLGIGRQAVGLK